MVRKKIVAGNWKMNLDQESAVELVNSLTGSTKYSERVERLLFPSFPFLKSVSDLLAGEKNFFTGAQDCSANESGAYTGEVSAAMLRSVGCSYVLVGHSERRHYFNESDDLLVAKIRQALAQNLKVIFCFGELLQERKAGTHFPTVEKQLRAVLSEFPVERTGDLVLAYEPVWAIGTGETATPQQAQEMHAFVRKTLSGIFTETVASGLRILYGGSCNAQNAAELFDCPDVDGGLIGGASLKAKDFSTIINLFS